jgi:hypothetical protein
MHEHYLGERITGPPQNRPELTITPEVDPRFGTYSEGTSIKAMCTVTDARPAANLLWFMGELLLHPFLNNWSYGQLN